MANETIALLNRPLPDETLGEDDYQSFCAAVGASARGRTFLAEYARRNRHADTEVVLEALARLEEVARHQRAAPEAERIRQDLRALLDTLRAARPQVDNSPGAIKAATLAALIDFVQARLEALIVTQRAPPAEVPEPEQPELPIPSPAAAVAPAIALVQPEAAREVSPLVVPAASQVSPDLSFDAGRLDTAHAPEPEKLAQPEPIGPGPAFGQDIAAAPQPRPRAIVSDASYLNSALPMPAPLDAPGPNPVLTPTPEAAAPVTPPVSAARSALAATLDQPEPFAVRETARSVIAAAIEFAPPVPPKPPAAKTEDASAAGNALAGILSLTEEERLALFT